jgi:hypothetical protein
VDAPAEVEGGFGDRPPGRERRLRVGGDLGVHRQPRRRQRYTRASSSSGSVAPRSLSRPASHAGVVDGGGRSSTATVLSASTESLRWPWVTAQPQRPQRGARREPGALQHLGEPGEVAAEAEEGGADALAGAVRAEAGELDGAQPGQPALDGHERGQHPAVRPRHVRTSWRSRSAW